MSKVTRIWVGRCACSFCGDCPTYFTAKRKKTLINAPHSGMGGHYCQRGFEETTGIKLKPGDIRKVRLEVVE